MTIVILSALALLLLPAAARGEVYVVNPEGSGDFPDIQTAVTAAANGDVIELTDGTFTGYGNRDVDLLGKTLTIRSVGGDPAACIIDSEGSETDPHRGFQQRRGDPAGTTLAGITIEGGWTEILDPGSAVRCDSSAVLRLDSCVLSGNAGRALYCGVDTEVSLDHCGVFRNPGGGIEAYSSSLFLDQCELAENTADRGGALLCSYADLDIAQSVFSGNSGQAASAIDCRGYCTAAVRECLFTQNEIASYDGIVSLFLACQGEFDRCTFYRNHAQGSILYSEKMSSTHVTGCTFWGNDARDATILAGNLEMTLENSIIAFNTTGPAVFSYYDWAALSCCDLFGNEGGDWVGAIADQYGVDGNIAEDPAFCDPEGGDFTLAEGSPCAPFTPPNPGCDLIGAWPVGCEPTAVLRTTWGNLKTCFRSVRPRPRP